MNSKIKTLHRTIWLVLFIGVISLFFTGCVVYDGTYQTNPSSYYDDYDRIIMLTKLILMVLQLKLIQQG